MFEIIPSYLERSAVLKRRHAGRAAVDHGGGGRGGRAGRIGRLAAAGPGDRRAAVAAAAAQLLVDLARLGVVLDVLHLGGLARVDGDWGETESLGRYNPGMIIIGTT